MVLFHDSFIMLPVRNVKTLFLEVSIEMKISSQYINVKDNVQVSNVCNYQIYYIFLFSNDYVIVCPPTCSVEF